MLSHEPTTIDVQPSHVGNGSTAIVPAEPRALAPRTANPLDIPKAQFAKALKRRGDNREQLMSWIREHLVENVDYGRVHVVKREKCQHGGPPRCTYDAEPYHWSKHSLRKPGAEKICGMLGLTPVFPTLPEYEKLALTGQRIETIILRCHLIGPDGQVVADGVGGRTVTFDNGNVNKALKMAEKSAHIDATLRCGGLSEVFTQDLEDMQALEEARGSATPPEPPKPKGPDDLFGFGKQHRDTKIGELPADYIIWVLEKADRMPQAAKEICRAERERRESRGPEEKIAEKAAQIAPRVAASGAWTGEELVPGTVARFGLKPWKSLDAKLVAWLAENSKGATVRAQAAKEIERRDLDRQELVYEAPAADKRETRPGVESDFDDDIPFP